MRRSFSSAGGSTRPWAWRALAGLFILVLVLSSSPPPSHKAPLYQGTLTVAPASAQTPSVRNFTVSITYSGFNNGVLDLTVEQGDTVRITFVLDQSQINASDPTNHHVVGVSGYNVETAEIDSTHTQATIEFVADSLGTFVISCLTPECPTHYLMLGGSLKVVHSSQNVSTTSSSSTSVSTSSASSATTAVSTSSAQSSSSSSTATSTGSPSGGSSGPLDATVRTASVALSLLTLGVVVVLAMVLVVSRRAS